MLVSPGDGAAVAVAPIPTNPQQSQATIPPPAQPAAPALVPEADAAGPPSPAPSIPVRLLIPSLNLDATVEEVGVDSTGAMATPHRLNDVGWYSPGPAPGMGGDAVIDGHLGLPGSPLVFGDLPRLGVGDVVTTVGADGLRRRFRVTSSTSWPANSHPTGLFDPSGPPRLTLITCGGAYLRNSQKYTDRLIVEAEYIGS